MSFTTDHLSLESLSFGIHGGHHEIYHNNRTHPTDDAYLSSGPQSSRVYWGQLLGEWKNSMWNVGYHMCMKLDVILDYILAINDLKDTGMTPLLGTYPRVSIIERILGLNDHDITLILGYCPSDTPLIHFSQWDSPEPPFIDPQFRSMLTSSLGDTKEEGPHRRNMNVIHQNLAMAFIQTFFDPELDHSIRAFVGLTWIQHIVISDGFDDLGVSSALRKLDMGLWFEWVFVEGWKNGLADFNTIEIDSVELVSTFGSLFTQVPESHLQDNVKALEKQLKSFLNRHFVEDLDKRHTHRLNEDQLRAQLSTTQFPFRYISSSFYIHTLHHRPPPLLFGSLPLPIHLQLNRAQLVNLLSVNDLESDEVEYKKAHDLVMADSSVPIDVSVTREYWSQYPVLRLTEDPCVDLIFKCTRIFEVWAKGNNPAYTWRGRKETHEDLAVCCLKVLLNGNQDGILEYAKYTWSYHLSHSTPTTRLIELLGDYTDFIANRWRKLHSDFCSHPLLVIAWLEGVQGLKFPWSNIGALLSKWRYIYSITANGG
ncbi:hypothetical protein BDN72DRAFT_878714 [Pluteus cervinus]|uniref:Uncharacterized protein n=1 Tax=Pluteus cervinus TaxID=181527 RepID=A0ACD3AUK2_9AGAR|nr:hypothetical protein BDN72DRAFT_878714 [Pluteus cervinus]